MLSSSDNDLLTSTGPGSAMGDYFRRFWQPVALSSELPEPDGTPLRIKVLGEDLLAFRTTDGRVRSFPVNLTAPSLIWGPVWICASKSAWMFVVPASRLRVEISAVASGKLRRY